ncbi:MAG: hypothetical protein M3Q03_09010 [Chloroflexota bacterium]|nr:hypothetical protein [Chloroflexota bacterium]
MKTKIAAFALALAMMGGFVGSTAAQTNQQGGAAGVVAAVANVNVEDNEIDVAVVELNNSLSNLTALNNVLNNSPILSNNEITVGDITILEDFLNNNDINVTVQEFLNDNDIDVVVGDVIGIAILDDTDIVVFV